MNHSMSAFEIVHGFTVWRNGEIEGRFSNARCAAGTAMFLMEESRRAKRDDRIVLQWPDGKTVEGREISRILR